LSIKRFERTGHLHMLDAYVDFKGRGRHFSLRASASLRETLCRRRRLAFRTL
jgi:hypothetical protein